MQLEVGSGRFDLAIPAGHAVGSIPAWYHRPANMDPHGHIVIVLHGTSRAARTSRDNWSVQANKYGFFVVVPDFEVIHFPDPAYAYGNLWSPEPPHEFTGWAQSHCAILDRLFDEVNEALGARNRDFVLYGHSAGAAFAHRYLTFAPVDRVSRAVVANSGWYTMLDFGVPVPFGLKGVPVSEDRLRALLRKPVTVLVGDRDRSGPYPGWWPDGCHLQGEHRVERSRRYFDAAREMADTLGVAFNWRWQSVPEVGHENARMIAPAAQLVAGAPAEV